MKSAQPPTAERIRRWNATHSGNVAATALIAVNVAVFVIGAVSSGGNALTGGGRVDAFHQKWALVLPLVQDGEYWRLLTSGFLHYGLFHLALNMWALFQLGRALENTLGRARFVGVYFASLLAGSAAVLVMQRIGGESSWSFTAGASGAIFGLLGCLAAGMRARGISVMRSGIGATLLINLVITLTIPGISIGGHIGGLIGGGICGALLLSPRSGVSKQLANLVPVLVSVASIILAMAVSR